MKWCNHNYADQLHIMQGQIENLERGCTLLKKGVHSLKKLNTKKVAAIVAVLSTSVVKIKSTVLWYIFDIVLLAVIYPSLCHI